MVWSSVHVGALIEEYQKYPCLYAIKHPLYHNRNARVDALTKICEVLRELRPATTLEEIKIKFSSLRTTYQIEKRKMDKAIKSGAGVDFVYVPSLWYFEKISYLNEHITPRASTSNLDTCEERESQSLVSPVIGRSQNKLRNTISITEKEEYRNIDDTNLTQSSSYEIQDNDQYEEIIIEADEIMDVNGSQNNNQFDNSQKNTPQNKKRKISHKTYGDLENSVMKDASKALQDITNAIKTAPDETHSTENLYGQLVADRLRSITDNRQRLRAQQEIDAILYHFLIED